MLRSLDRGTLRVAGAAILAIVGLCVGWATTSAASPEDEIARLNRVRQNLFEELVQARREAASARAELEAAVKARQETEAELTRLNQRAASRQPAAQPANPRAGVARQPGATGSIAATPQIRAVRASAARPAPSKKVDAESRDEGHDEGHAGGWTGQNGGYGTADGSLSSNGPGIW